MTRQQTLIAALIALLTLLVGVLATLVVTGRRAPAAPVVTDRPPGPVAGSDGGSTVAVRPMPIAPVPAAPVARPPQPRPAAPTIDQANATAFAEAYLARQSTNDVSSLLGLYASQVRFYSIARATPQAIYDDKDAYFRRFPSRDYRLASGVRVTPRGDASLFRFDYTFAVGGGRGGSRSGSGWTELTVVPDRGTFLITGENGSVY